MSGPRWSTLARSRSAGGLAVHRRGAGPTLLLLHGVGLRAECWHAQIRALESRCAILAPDLPGHGESARLSLAEPSIGDYTDRIAELLAETQDPACVAGHSMGALIALDLAIRYPERCAAVVALCAIFQRSDEARRAVAARAATLSETLAAETDAGVDLATAPVARWFGASPSGAEAAAAAACRRWLLAADRTGYPVAYRAFAAADGPTETGLAGLRIPALFATGADDRNSTSEMARRMAALAPRGRCAIVEGAGHMVQMTHAAAVDAMLAEAVEDMGRARAAAPVPDSRAQASGERARNGGEEGRM